MTESDSTEIAFVLKGDVCAEYADKPLPFGFDGLGEFVYQRTYARTKDDGFTETWPETILRVTNGTYTMQKRHIFDYNLGWNEEQGQRSAREFYDRLFHLKWTPPGRGLWSMGSDIIHKRKLYAALNNCAFTTTGGIDIAPSVPFMFLMDMSMLGVGVGFDVAGANKVQVIGPSEVFLATDTDTAYSGRLSELMDVIDAVKTLSRYAVYLETQISKITVDADTPQFVRDAAMKDKAMYEEELNYINKLDPHCVESHVIPDSREGWVASVGIIIDSYIKKVYNGDNGVNDADTATSTHNGPVIFDYSEIRPEGERIHGFGGTASGPEPLLDLHIMLRRIFNPLIGKPITKTAIVDVMNLIGKAVVAGNVRRSSEIALGDPNDEEFMNLKNFEKNPDRAAWSWASNNSVYAKVGMDYTKLAERIADNGEPGVFWLENVRAFSRMGDAPDYKDHRVLGTNPCITADSIIATTAGPKLVKDLIGKQFTSIIYGDTSESTEEGFFKTGTKDVYKLTLESGHTLRLTEDHLVLAIKSNSTHEEIKTHKEFWPANELCKGDHIKIDCDSHWADMQDSPFVSLERDGTEDVYDCTILETHRFSANGIIVHNCGEQSLESTLDAGGEMCCLVETFPHRHESKEDFLRTVKFAYMYAKIVTLGNTHWVGTNRIQLRNRRIGFSVTGLTQFMAKHGIATLKDWLRSGYDTIQRWDKVYSDYLAIPRSIKTTSIKPSGCFTPDTKIRTIIDSNDRSMSIEDIFERNGYKLAELATASDLWLKPNTPIQVKDENNKLADITNLYINGIADIYEFELSDGTVVRCTEDHKFKLMSGKWKRAAELCEDDEIMVFD